MIGRKISHYKVLEEIGAGGMGIVYKAEDTKLNRTVALKFVVPRIIRKEEDKECFVREAQTAASLNHPNICTIYEIDEERENLFIAMEYVEGQSLKEIIQKGPLKMESILDIALQIADGLKEAHDEGVVHRDIKSSNILLTKKGQAKIMDFGLAKPLKEAQITETATIVGTVAYMSPEQATGEAFDHRTDIWSFGVVLYEMLSGQLPFGGEHQQLILYSILHKNPQPIANLPYVIPVELERIMNKCLEKEPSERYQYASELLEDLRRLKKETETGVVPSTRSIRPKIQRKRIQTVTVLGIFMLITVLLIAGYFLFDWFKHPVDWKTSIAVLPIEDGSFLGEYEALCMSTTRGIIFKLAKFSPELRVVPYDSVRKYKDLKKVSVEIGQELSVEYVLVSSFDSVEERIRINAELIDVETNTNRLPISGEFGIKDIFDIEDEISKKIVGELGLLFAESGLIATKKREPKSIEAYNWYVKGMDIIEKVESYSDLEEWFTDAISMFEKAVNIDPNYALAYWGLGIAYEHYYVERDRREDLESAIDHFEKAYDLNPDLAEANLGLGWAYFYREDLGKASNSFKRALELEKDSKSALTTCDVGAFLSSVGLFPAAIKYFSKAIQLEPSYLRAYEHRASCHWYLGEYEEGVEVMEKALGLEKNYASLYLLLARHLIMMEKYFEAEKAIGEAEKINPDSLSVKHHRALILAAKGEKDEALSLIKGAEESYSYLITCIYSLLGMKTESIENIKMGIKFGFKEVQNHLYSYLLLKENLGYHNLLDDPRFKEILKSQGEIYNQSIKILKDLL